MTDIERVLFTTFIQEQAPSQAASPRLGTVRDLGFPPLAGFAAL